MGDDAVRSLFAQFGEVTEVCVIKDSKNESKGVFLSYQVNAIHRLEVKTVNGYSQVMPSLKWHRRILHSMLFNIVLVK